MDPTLAPFLATIPAFSAMEQSALEALTGHFETQEFPRGTAILRTDTYSPALYILRRGRAAVVVDRGEGQEVLAELQPPSLFGELSFLTGRRCSADVVALDTVQVAVLHRSALDDMKEHGDLVRRHLLDVLARRLHDTATKGTEVRLRATVLLRTDVGFPAASSFPAEFSRRLAEETGEATLLIEAGSRSGEIRETEELLFATGLPQPDELVAKLDSWKSDFRNVIYVPPPAANRATPAEAEHFDFVGHLACAGAEPITLAENHFIVQDAEHSTLERLSGNAQLLRDACSSEDEARGQHSITSPRFRHTAASLARWVAGHQIGVALGGGGACCWSHVGVLEVLERAGIPIDIVAGSSMGSFVGAMVANGAELDSLRGVAEHFRTRSWRMVEPFFWRGHLISDRKLRRALRRYLGDVELNQLHLPYWANAVDVLTGEEAMIDQGLASEAVRASMSLPGSSPPYASGDKLLVDAAVLAPVPVRPVREMGARFVIAINVMPSMHGGKIRTGYPFNLLDLVQRCIRLSGHEIGKARADAEADVVINPELEDYDLLAFRHCREIIAAGTVAADAAIGEIETRYKRFSRTA